MSSNPAAGQTFNTTAQNNQKHIGDLFTRSTPPASLPPRRDTSADSQLAPYERLATDKYDRSVDSHHKAIDGINIANGLPEMRTVAQVRCVVSYLHVSLLTRDARTGS